MISSAMPQSENDVFHMMATMEPEELPRLENPYLIREEFLSRIYISGASYATETEFQERYMTGKDKYLYFPTHKLYFNTKDKEECVKAIYRCGNINIEVVSNEYSDGQMGNTIQLAVHHDVPCMVYLDVSDSMYTKLHKVLTPDEELLDKLVKSITYNQWKYVLHLQNSKVSHSVTKSIVKKQPISSRDIMPAMLLNDLLAKAAGLYTYDIKMLLKEAKAYLGTELNGFHFDSMRMTSQTPGRLRILCHFNRIVNHDKKFSFWAVITISEMLRIGIVPEDAVLYDIEVGDANFSSVIDSNESLELTGKFLEKPFDFFNTLFNLFSKYKFNIKSLARRDE